MIRPNYVKRVAVWVILAIVFVVAVYELAYFAISVGSGDQ